MSHKHNDKCNENDEEELDIKLQSTPKIKVKNVNPSEAPKYFEESDNYSIFLMDNKY